MKKYNFIEFCKMCTKIKLDICNHYRTFEFVGFVESYVVNVKDNTRKIIL